MKNGLFGEMRFYDALKSKSRGIEVKKCSLLLRVLVLVAIGLAVVLSAAPVYADTPYPDGDPTIESLNVYRNLLETGDFLLLIYANIPYDAPVPDDLVTETYIWRMIDTDNITELGSTVGYAVNDKGYGLNVSSMYWSADNVTSQGLVWGTEYTVRLSGNPAAFDTPRTYNFTIDSTDYTGKVATADVQEEMGVRIITIATELNIKWALDSDFYLTQQTEVGTRLSIYGEALFRGAILGLQGMVPQIFGYVVTDMEVTAREWDVEYSENLTGQWAGTWIGTAQAAGGALFGTDYDLASLLLMAALAIGVIVCNLMVAGDTWAGAVDACFILLIGSRLALIGLGYVGLIVALCMLYISARMWGLARG